MNLETPEIIHSSEIAHIRLSDWSPTYKLGLPLREYDITSNTIAEPTANQTRTDNKMRHLYTATTKP